MRLATRHSQMPGAPFSDTVSPFRTPRRARPAVRRRLAALRRARRHAHARARRPGLLPSARSSRRQGSEASWVEVTKRILLLALLWAIGEEKETIFCIDDALYLDEMSWAICRDLCNNAEDLLEHYTFFPEACGTFLEKHVANKNKHRLMLALGLRPMAANSDLVDSDVPPAFEALCEHEDMVQVLRITRMSKEEVKQVFLSNIASDTGACVWLHRVAHAGRNLRRATCGRHMRPWCPLLARTFAWRRPPTPARRGAQCRASLAPSPPPSPPPASLPRDARSPDDPACSASGPALRSAGVRDQGEDARPRPRALRRQPALRA